MASADKATVRAEYIAGGISLRDIADKYDLKRQTVMSWAHRENWEEQRQAVASKVQAKRNQKIAENVAKVEVDNATIAASIKTDLLLILKRTAENFPKDGTEVKTTDKGKTVKYSIKDLTAAYKDLTSDIPVGSSSKAETLLQEIADGINEGRKLYVEQ